MGRFIDWFEDNYMYIAMIVVIVVFGFGGIVSYCDKIAESDNDYKDRQWEVKKMEIENREAFFDKYCSGLTQFSDATSFSIWVDEAQFESIALLHDYVIEKYGDFAEEDGFQQMIDYLAWKEPEIIYSGDYDY